MARILGVEIPDQKRVEASLPYIYGVGRRSAKRILQDSGVNPDTRVKDLSPEQISIISKSISTLGLVVEGDLRREIQNNMKRIMSINCYRALRHRMGLPVRGQRTSTNARTRKGKRKTVGVQKRAGAKKGVV